MISVYLFAMTNPLILLNILINKKLKTYTVLQISPEKIINKNYMGSNVVNTQRPK